MILFLDLLRQKPYLYQFSMLGYALNLRYEWKCNFQNGGGAFWGQILTKIKSAPKWQPLSISPWNFQNLLVSTVLVIGPNFSKICDIRVSGPDDLTWNCRGQDSFVEKCLFYIVNWMTKRHFCHLIDNTSRCGHVRCGWWRLWSHQG